MMSSTTTSWTDEEINHHVRRERPRLIKSHEHGIAIV